MHNRGGGRQHVLHFLKNEHNNKWYVKKKQEEAYYIYPPAHIIASGSFL